jgi:electron transfer flavoprotein beta subunit
VKIVVCVKQVAVVGDEVELREDGRDIDRDLLDRALNEWDAYAVEAALRLRESRSGGGEVVVVSAGDEEAEDALRRCLAMGAERGVRVWRRELAGADPLVVAHALAEAVRREAPDLVLTGVQSADAVQAATGAALAELLGLPCVAVVTRVELDDASSTAAVNRELEGGLVEVLEVDLPALLTIQTGGYRPRYANFRAIKQAERLELELVEPETVAAPAARLRRMFVPPPAEGAELLEGDAAAIAARIAAIVRERVG